MPIQDKTDAELGLFDATRDVQSARNTIQVKMKAQLIALKDTVDGAIATAIEAVAEAPDLDTPHNQAKGAEWVAFRNKVQGGINAWDTFFST